MSITEDEVKKAQEETAAAFIEHGFAKSREEVDVSYITAELLERYKNAEDKNEASCSDPCEEMGEELLKEDLVNKNDYPCYIGNTPVHKGGNKWQYENNNSSDGCDRKEHLCTSGKVWTAKCNKIMKDRYCRNGKKGFLGWP